MPKQIELMTTVSKVAIIIVLTVTGITFFSSMLIN